VVISDLNIKTLESSSFGQNAYIVHFKNSKNCFIVDAGFDAEQIVKYLKKHELNPVAILVTHGHFDHIAGNEEIKSNWDKCKIYVGEYEIDKLVNPKGNLSASFGFPKVSPEVDCPVCDGQKLLVADIPVTVLHTPGHSCGHVVYQISGDDGTIVFVGDLIFLDSIGRYDFPDGNYSDLIDSIREKILVLPGNTVLFPGHGPKTTVERERRYNKFLQGDVC